MNDVNLQLAESSSLNDDDDDSLGGEQKQHDALKDVKMKREPKEWDNFAVLLVEQVVAADSERMTEVKECLKASGRLAHFILQVAQNGHK